MKTIFNKISREFSVGCKKDIVIKDQGKIYLSDNEQITLMTSKNNEFDIVKKDWGYYATPSLNGRLKKFNLRSVLVRNESDQYYILMVERGLEDSFKQYIHEEKQKIICWLDSTENLKQLENKMSET